MSLEAETLHDGVFMPHLLVAALERNLDRPAVYLGDEILTGRQVRDEISRYAQALASLGIVKGSSISVLSKNRPEVLFNSGAQMISGCRATPLHPLGSLDDHAYAVDDAEIETLVFDPSFAERAAALLAHKPSLRLLSFGPAPLGNDLIELASSFAPAPLRVADAATRRHLRAVLHRRHDRQAQGRHGHVPQRRHHDGHPDGRVAVAG